ncbi:hypothetical protein [Streptococcus loxodontisalivarius]|uniref:ABC-type lipoprotein release transport system permease subunit n=1 Tax=Streptococcus loxodontisalivarius TaxID=1349415 RepID=A0ABS2PQM4_9STRE|nr:hypothetical protein [Streptococcus loxodontisalivarius]MBM7642344.1 ABC-type lipoprotein release transport system permease subunit [Streptococcus loxodontisalivarius]
MANNKKSRETFLLEGLMIGLVAGILLSLWGVWFGYSWLGIGIVAGSLLGSAIKKEK